MSEKKPFKLKQAAIRMVSAPPIHSEEPLDSPDAAIRVMAKELKDYDREVVCVINLKSNLQPINFSLVSMGALNESMVHPREFMKNVILSNSANIIMVHNHPSGRLHPSEEDISITDRMQQICSLMGVGLLDHIIIGGGNDRSYYSLHEQGELPVEKNRFTSEIDQLKWPQGKVAETAQSYDRGSVLQKLGKQKADRLNHDGEKSRKTAELSR